MPRQATNVFSDMKKNIATAMNASIYCKYKDMRRRRVCFLGFGIQRWKGIPLAGLLQLCPSFHEVSVSIQAIEAQGWLSDCLPESDLLYGTLIRGRTEMLFNSSLSLKDD